MRNIDADECSRKSSMLWPIVDSNVILLVFLPVAIQYVVHGSVLAVLFVKQ